MTCLKGMYILNLDTFTNLSFKGIVDDRGHGIVYITKPYQNTSVIENIIENILRCKDYKKIILFSFRFQCLIKFECLKMYLLTTCSSCSLNSPIIFLF